MGEIMSVYTIVHFNVVDPETFAKYPEPAMKTVFDHGGKYHVVAGLPGLAQPQMPEGSTDYGVIVVLEFPSQEAVDGWYNSPEYQDIIELRTGSTEGWAMVVDGFEMPG
jgi:uncharacterized protein (DUF1330 family)